MEIKTSRKTEQVGDSIVNNLDYDTPYGSSRATVAVGSGRSGIWLTSDFGGDEFNLNTRLTVSGTVMRVQLDRIGRFELPLYATLTDGSAERHICKGDETLDSAEYETAVMEFTRMIKIVAEDVAAAGVQNPLTRYASLLERAMPFPNLTKLPENFFECTSTSYIIP